MIKFMLSKNARYVFNFCTRWNFTLSKMAIERQNCMARLCYVTTQKYRMYLLLSPKGLRYSPCVKGENQWLPVPVEKRVPTPDGARMFDNPEVLENQMKEDFFLQFPEAEVTFFENLPSCQEVRATLELNPYGAEMSKRFYMFTRYDEVEVEDADGVVDVLCEEGILSIPFTNCNPELRNDFELQMYRSLLHPDSKIGYANQLFWGFVDNISSNLRSFSWGSVRRLIDRTIQ